MLTTSKSDNIVVFDLDLPERTTIDYEGPSVEPKIQAALDAALNEEDIAFVAQYLLWFPSELTITLGTICQT
jgi:hypothetical protein